MDTDLTKENARLRHENEVLRDANAKLLERFMAERGDKLIPAPGKRHGTTPAELVFFPSGTIDPVQACEGVRCPGRGNCKRYLAGIAKNHIGYAAFYARREAGADACDAYLPVVKRSTFEASDNTEVSGAGTASA